jgi:hypothetical protein
MMARTIDGRGAARGGGEKPSLAVSAAIAADRCFPRRWRHLTRGLLPSKAIAWAGRTATPAAPVTADYRSINLDDIGELLLALKRGSVLSDRSYQLLVDGLSGAPMRCTPTLRASAMEQFEAALLSQVALPYRQFMQTALAPLGSAISPGLIDLPDC